MLIETNYGEEINAFEEFSFKVESVKLEDDRLIKVTYINPVALYPAYKSTINLRASTSRNSF